MALIVASGIYGCRGDTTSPQPTPLDGLWSTHVIGLGLVLDLEWSADSVRGSGSYAAWSPQIGCGGATLPSSGTVRFAAARSATGGIRGFMTFDNGWTPPYDGTLESDSHVSGAFRSIDAGSCLLDLYRGLVP